MVRVRAWLVLAVSLALTAAALVYSFRTLSMNTDTTEMISPEVPFRRNDIAFRKAFPRFKDTIVIVIDGVTPERAGDAARRLGERLKLGKSVRKNMDGVMPGRAGDAAGRLKGVKRPEIGKIGTEGAENGKIGNERAENGKKGLGDGEKLFKSVLIPGETRFSDETGFFFWTPMNSHALPIVLPPPSPCWPPWRRTRPCAVL